MRVIAAFDFDGTLSTRDNVVPFLRRVAGTLPTVRAFGGSGARLAARGPAAWSRDTVKAAIVERVLAGRDAPAVDDLASTFARGVVASHLRREALERVDWHRAQDHRLVIVSASKPRWCATGRR